MQPNHPDAPSRFALPRALCSVLLLGAFVCTAGCSSEPSDDGHRGIANTPQQVTLPTTCATTSAPAPKLTRADVIQQLAEHGIVFAQRGQSTRLTVPVDHWFNTGTANWRPNPAQQDQPRDWANLVLLLKSYTITELDVSVLTHPTQRPGGKALHQAQADAVAQALLADGLHPPLLTTHARTRQPHRAQQPNVVLQFQYVPKDATT